jgi:Glycosyl transferase family 2
MVLDSRLRIRPELRWAPATGRPVGTPARRERAAVNYPCEIELIVVDDGSSDATASIVAQFTDPRLILHRHESSKGRGAALRMAAALASNFRANARGSTALRGHRVGLQCGTPTRLSNRKSNVTNG